MSLKQKLFRLLNHGNLGLKQEPGQLNNLHIFAFLMENRNLYKERKVPLYWLCFWHVEWGGFKICLQILETLLFKRCGLVSFPLNTASNKQNVAEVMLWDFCG